MSTGSAVISIGGKQKPPLKSGQLWKHNDVFCLIADEGVGTVQNGDGITYRVVALSTYPFVYRFDHKTMESFKQQAEFIANGFDMLLKF